MSQSRRVKEASQIPVGGSEDEAKERVKELFKPTADVCKFMNMSEEELEQYEELHWLDFVAQQARTFSWKI